MTTTDLLLKFDEPGGCRSVVIEDDGRVVYAYILRNGKIVGDVWLYNSGGTPETIDTNDRSQLPFPNPRRYCREDLPEHEVMEDSAVNCRWDEAGVDLDIDGVRVARLEEGAMPGWSRLSRVANRMAKPLLAEPKA